jgi:hypothetical protein
MNIIEGNKLIAEFLGLNSELSSYYLPQFGEYTNNYGNIEWNDCFRNEELKFHNSWDWLMQVVEKISKIFGQWDYEDPNRIKAEDIFYMDNMFSEFIDADIEAIYSRVVEFIKWYNENKID